VSSHKAFEAANVDSLERRVVVIPAKNWKRFEAWAAQPPCEIDAIKELATRPPTWRE
jgi:hypothetical protein